MVTGLGLLAVSAVAGVVGSVAYNATATLGAAALVRPLATGGLLWPALAAGLLPLLLRLLALEAATHAGFCWIDEPLEHLDPDTRRQVASLLAVTPSASGVGQMLVTTYEVPLVRRITRRMPGQARLVRVRAGSDGG